MEVFAVADWTQVGMFWVTTVYAVITLAALTVNYFLLRSLNDPSVIVYARSDDARRQMIMVVIQNIGEGVAKNVRFTLSEPLPAHPPGGGPIKTMDTGPLITGIPALAPGESRVIFWGMFLALRPLIADRTFSVTARFDGTLLGWFKSDEFEVENILEVASYDRCDAVDTDGARQSAAELKRIADAVEAELSRRHEEADR